MDRTVPWAGIGRRVVVAVVAVTLAGWADFAAADWPAESPGWFSRGTGGGLAILPLAVWWLLGLCWVSSSSWVGEDVASRSLPARLWVPLVVFPFFAVAMLAWWIPSAIVGEILMAIAWAVPLGIYARVRNARVAEDERVFTRNQAIRIAGRALRPLGIKVKTPAKVIRDSLPEVGLLDASGEPASCGEAEQPVLEELTRRLANAVASRADAIMIERNGAAAVIRQRVDAVWATPRRPSPRKRLAMQAEEGWEEVPPPSAEEAAAMLAILGRACGLKGKSASRQGRCRLSVDGRTTDGRLTAAATAGGERIVLELQTPPRKFTAVGELGLPEPLVERVRSLLALERGIFVVTTPPGNGLSTLFNIVAGSTDRLLRDFVSIEDGRRPPDEVPNVKRCPWDAEGGVSPSDALAAAMRSYPQGIMTRNLQDKALALELARLAGESCFVLLSIPAADACDAIERLIAVGIPRQPLARSLLGVLSGRLIRRLCPHCREAFDTPPAVAARLKITPEACPQLHRASAVGCRLCRGLGYASRTGIFELASGRKLNEAVLKRVDGSLLKKVAVQQGMRPLSSAAMGMVLQGETSLEEMQRVFKKA